VTQAVSRSPRRSGFDHSPVHVRFVFQNMALAQVFIRASDVKIFSLFVESKRLTRPFLMKLLNTKGKRQSYNRPRKRRGTRWVWWSSSRPGRFNLRKTRYPLYRRRGGPQGSGRVRKISPPPRFDPWTVQHIASHYTD
jgi:hypothetical protein